MHSVEGSLQRLGVDYIDLLWIHFWEYSTDIVDVMRNVNDLVQQGKVLHFGLCNTPAWVVARGQTVAEQRGWEPISAPRNQLGRGGPGVGARPRRDPDDRGPESFPDRGQPAIPVTHLARRGHAGAERGERPGSALDVLPAT